LPLLSPRRRHPTYAPSPYTTLFRSAVYAHLPVARPGPYTGQWSSERISEMLRNETYLGHMVQGRSVKVSYKSKKCRRQAPSDWRSEEHTSELQSRFDLVCRLLLDKK